MMIRSKFLLFPRRRESSDDPQNMIYPNLLRSYAFSYQPAEKTEFFESVTIILYSLDQAQLGIAEKKSKGGAI
jgi:hypothetical protein